MAFDRPVICPVIIGRASELAALQAFVDITGKGQGRVGLVHGEAGIGKSRLVVEAKKAALAHGFLTLQGDCFQADAAFPYAPIIDLLRVFLASRPPAALPVDQAPFWSEFVRWFPDLEPLAPQPVPSPFTQKLDPEQQKRRLFSLLTQLFTHQTARQPVLLIVEDLHWCDPSSLELLLHLVHHTANQPLCFLFTYRTEEISPDLSHWLAQLDRQRLSLELGLERLSQAEIGAMLQAIFASPQTVPARLLDAIYIQTEGNPFFVEEMLPSFISSGAWQYVDGVWKRGSTAYDPGGFSFIPRSVEDAVKQRVDQLGPLAKQVLTMAAAAGRRFEFPLLQQALHIGEEDLLALNRELVAAQLIVEESADQFAFRHTLVQQAIYRSLLVRERRLYHRVIAHAYETINAAPSQREAHLPDLAFHFFAAGDWEPALEYNQLAGERALTLYAPIAAATNLTHALEAASQLNVAPPGRVFYLRGQASATLGEFDRARKDFERALDSARQAADDLLEWQCMLALGFLWAGRDYARAGEWFQAASDRALRLANPGLRARSLNRLGNWQLNTGRIAESLRTHSDALMIFEEQYNLQGIAETLDLLGIASGMLGDRVEAVQKLDQAIALFRSLGDTHSLVSSLAMRALQSMPGASETTICPLRTLGECVQDASEALQLARQIDSLAGQAFAENALAHTLLSFGEFSQALYHAQETRRIAGEIEHQQWMVAAAHCLGRLYRLLLAPLPASEALEAGLSLAQKLGSAFWTATLAAELGSAYILKGDLPAAQDTLQAVMPREQAPRNVAERVVALTWGELALAQGEPGTALQIANQLLASAPRKEGGQPTQPIPHLLKLRGEALTALSRLDEAIEALETAKQGAQQRSDRPLLWTIYRALGQARQALQYKERARLDWTAARQLIEELAAIIEDASLSEPFTRAALGTFPQERPLSSREAARQAFGGLTAREREVASLIAEGKTSRQIADQLVVSERTVEVHVGNILRRLGFTSRAQIAVWAVEKGLSKSPGPRT